MSQTQKEDAVLDKAAATQALARQERDGPVVATRPTATLPILSGAELTAALLNYRDLQAALDRAMPDQIMVLDGKPFRKKGYWRAIRLAFHLSVEPTTPDATRHVVGVLQDGTDDYCYHVIYRATAPNGVTCTGDGTCAASEKTKGRMHATEHNVCSHAHTRAMNRAISNSVGFGEVSAEEVSPPSADGPTIQRRAGGAAPVVTVTAISTVAGISKARGKPYTRYTVTLSDGRSGSTFDDAMVLDAERWKDGAVPVEALFVKNGNYVNLTGLKEARAVVSATPSPTDEDGIPPPDDDDIAF